MRHNLRPGTRLYFKKLPRWLMRSTEENTAYVSWRRVCRLSKNDWHKLCTYLAHVEGEDREGRVAKGVKVRFRLLRFQFAQREKERGRVLVRELFQLTFQHASEIKSSETEAEVRCLHVAAFRLDEICIGTCICIYTYFFFFNDKLCKRRTTKRSKFTFPACDLCKVQSTVEQSYYCGKK